MQGLSFSCEECVEEINKIFKGFRYKFSPDFRNQIAQGWPDDLNDNIARKDWRWNPICKDLTSLSEQMLKNMKINTKIKMSLH
jgi:hypothetical protein